MKTSLISLLLVAATALSAPGCATGPDADEDASGEDVGSAAQALGDPPSTKNGKRGHCFFDPGTVQAYQFWGNQALDSGGRLLPTFTGILTGCRDEVIENVIGCALRQDQWVRDPVNGNVYTGWSGLAPEWYSSPLGADGRRWVTACMGQRLNAYGVEVPILLKGNTPPIYEVPLLDLEYPFKESTVYGDVFSVSTTGFKLNVCANKDLYTRCKTLGLDPEDWLRKRICDDFPGCGLNVMGSCELVCDDLSTGYKECRRPDGTFDDHTVAVQLREAVSCNARPE